MAISQCVTAVDSRGHELLAHGVPAFPLACYHDNLALCPVPWHWHDELEAVVVERGRCVVGAGAQKFVLSPGEGYFVNAGVLHAAWDLDASGCRFHSVVFHPRLVGGSLDSAFWHRYLQPLLECAPFKELKLTPAVPWHARALRAVEQAWQSAVEEPPGYEFAARQALSDLVLALCLHMPAAPVRPGAKALRDAGRIKLMLAYIHAHYAEALTTARIARSAAISESECLRCFRHTIGATPIQYLRQLRIQKAAELLLGTGAKVSEIAAQCGFQEMSYFAKTFRELRGLSPTEFRLRRGQAGG